uniref:SAM domain-containing protein n=1 Tax=Rhabditophanes sp. KR3021 TaxID=114890 RepID=A0AC35TVV8_9BILA
MTLSYNSYLEDKWYQFFTDAKLSSSISSLYASFFVRHRIQNQLLQQLKKEDLASMGIDAIGDQITILNHIGKMHSVRSNPSADVKPIVYNKSVGLSASEARRGKAAPDRHETYNVKMPEGKSEKTKRILEEVERLRMNGLLKRGGTSGVRQNGKTIKDLPNDTHKPSSQILNSIQRNPRDTVVTPKKTANILSRVSVVGSGRVPASAKVTSTTPTLSRIPVSQKKSILDRVTIHDRITKSHVAEVKPSILNRISLRR